MPIQRKQRTTTKMTTKQSRLLTAMVTLFAATTSVYCASSWQTIGQQNHSPQQQTRATYLAARRAADDSRPLLRLASPINVDNVASSRGPRAAESQLSNDQIILGRFKAPAPERIQRQRVPSSSNFATQTISASYRVAEPDSQEEKIVHGLHGASTKPQSIQQQVGAKIMVSDEGLNYPPSKLSADIHGNVAEIVTAPPEAVDNDFLFPKSSRFSSRP